MPTYEHRHTDFTQLYSALGQFAVEFEKVSTALRFHYSVMLQREGLNVWSLGSNLLNIPQIGPQLLAQAFCAGVQQTSDDVGLKARASKLAPRSQKLAEARNEVLHGEWFVGDGVVEISDSPIPSEQHGIKRKPTKDGEKVTPLPRVTEINLLIEEAKAICQEVQAISNTMTIAHFHAHPELYSSVTGT